MNRNKTRAILLGISFILLWSVTSSVSSPNAEGSPSYNDIKDIDLIGREELLHSLKVKPSFLNDIEEIEDTSENIKYDTTYHLLDGEKKFIGMTDEEFESYFENNIESVDKVMNKQNLVRKTSEDDKLYNLGEMIDAEYEYYKKLDKNYVKDYATIIQRNSNMGLIQTMDLTNNEYDLEHNNTDQIQRNKIKEYYYDVSDSKRLEFKNYYDSINNTVNGVFSDENIAGALGITEQQLNKLTSGYAPYSMSRVTQFNTKHPELLMLTVLFRDTEAHMMPVENKTEKMVQEELVRPDLYIGDMLIVLDDSKVTIDTADNFMMECLKLRKHDATAVYRSLDSIYKAVNEKSIFGDYNLNYVILTLKGDEDRKIAAITSMDKLKNAQGKTLYRISLAMIKTTNLSGITNGASSIGVDQPENYNNNKMYEFKTIEITSISEFALYLHNDAGIMTEYKLSDIISTPSKIDATIDNNFYLTTPSGPILVDLSRAK